MAGAIKEVAFHTKDFASRVTIDVTLSGVREFVWRCRIATWLVRIAAWVAWMGVEVHQDPVCPYCKGRLTPFRSDVGAFRYGWQCDCNPFEARRHAERG